MAHIKCRYIKKRCNYPHGMNIGRICRDPEYGEGCPHDAFVDHWEDGDIHVLSLVCRYVKDEVAEFEGDFKKYEYENGLFHVPHRYIDSNKIIYLEIDGRIIEDKGAA